MHTSNQPRPHGLRGRARLLIATATVLAITGCGSATPDTSSAIGPTEFADRVISAALKANTLHMRFDSGGDSIRADIVLNDESDMLASDLSMSTRQPLLVRWKNGRIYVKGKSLAKGWVAADPTDPRDPVGAQFGYVRTLNPVTLVKDARETAIALHRVGTEVVEGTRTTHYSMTLDPELATSGSTINAEGLRAQGHQGKLVYEFWLDEKRSDDRGHLRRCGTHRQGAYVRVGHAEGRRGADQGAHHSRTRDARVFLTYRFARSIRDHWLRGRTFLQLTSRPVAQRTALTSPFELSPQSPNGLWLDTRESDCL